MLGDSNALRYFPMLIHFIAKTYSSNCWIRKLENMTSHTIYGQRRWGRTMLRDVLDKAWNFRYHDPEISQRLLVEMRGIFQEFIQYIADETPKLNDHKKGQFLNKKDYFTDCDKELTSRMRIDDSKRIYCSCPCLQIQCHHPRGMLNDIRLEFIMMPKIQTSWITLAQPKKGEKTSSSGLNSTRTAPWISGEAADSYQEYTFQNYLHQQQNMTVFMFLPAKHMKVGGKAKSQISYFASLLKKYISSEAQFYIIPDFGEREDVKPDRFRNKRYEGLLATAMVDRINHYLFDAIKEPLLLKKNRTFHGFIDLLKMGQHVNHWSIDGAHRFSRWYEVVMSLLLQLTCNEQ